MREVFRRVPRSVPASNLWALTSKQVFHLPKVKTMLLQAVISEVIWDLRAATSLCGSSVCRISRRVPFERLFPFLDDFDLLITFLARGINVTAFGVIRLEAAAVMVKNPCFAVNSSHTLN